MAENLFSDTLTGGAEQTIYDASGDATYICHVDLVNLVDGDLVTLRAKAPGEGGTYRTVAIRDVVGGEEDVEMVTFGPHAHNNGIRYTLEQAVGTGKDMLCEVDAL